MSIELFEIFNIIIIIYTLSSKKFQFRSKDATLVINLSRCFAFLAMTTQLIGFHIFLRFKKMTTLEFIMRKKSNLVSPRSQIVNTGWKQADELNETSKL